MRAMHPRSIRPVPATRPGNTPGSRHTCLALAVAAALVLGSPAVFGQAAPGTPVQLNIPAQPLGAALTELARQARLQLLVAPELVAGKTAPAVQGNLAPEAALRQLLGGSGLEAVNQGGTVVVRTALPAAQSGTTLPEVQVIAKPDPAELPKPYAGGQVARGANLGMLGNTDMMDSPVSSTSYTAKAIADQQARSLGDVLVLDPGVRITSSGGAYETFYIRGFQVPAIPGEIAFNGVYGLMPDRRTAIDYAERVEVLRGPTALLTGMAPGGGVGGVINVVPKRAGDVPLTRLSAGFVSDRQFTTSADVGRRFGLENRWGIRVNGAWRDGETPKDGMSKTLGLASMALDYRGEQLRVSLDTIYQKDQDRGNSDLGVAFSSGVVTPAPSARLALVPGGFTRHEDKIIQLRGEYDLSPDTTMHASYGQRRSTFFALAGVPFGFDAAGNGLAATAYQRAGFDVDSADAGMKTRFSTGPVNHSLAFNISELESLQYLSSLNGTPTQTNLYNPVPLPFPAAPPASAAKVDFTRLTSYALADTASFADDRLKVTFGLRNQQVKVYPYAADGSRALTYNRSAVTPMLGVVFKAAREVSLYANYLEGLSQGPTAPTNVVGLLNPGQIFAPIKTKQQEAGVKLDTGSLGGTLSFFNIKRPNSGTVGNVFGIYGEQQNRGMELNVFGEPLKGLRLLGGATLIHARINERIAATQGKTPTGVPKVQVNAGIEWDPSAAPGTTLILRNLYTSGQFLDAANSQRLPSWARWDAGVRYATTIDGKPVVLRASVENLFNKNYYAAVNTFASLGAPRTFVASVTTDF